MFLIWNSTVEGLGLLLIGGALGVGLFFWKARKTRTSLLTREQCLLENSRKEAESLLRDARLAASEEVLKLRDQSDRLVAKRRQELDELEKRLAEREKLINRQLENLVDEEKALRAQQVSLQEKFSALEVERLEIARLSHRRKDELARISHLTPEDARNLFLKEVEEESRRDATKLSRRIVDEAKLKAEEQARRIIALAIQRYAGEHTFETTTATISLPNEEIKGRIIGREGRNIRAFEAATGITVLIDDTPNAVVLSGFDPVRREIARESMQRLILDGRIHPTRIEEVVHKVSQEMDETILRAGNEALFKVGLPTVHLEIVKLLGRLRFRHSFSQNVLDHSVEVAHLVGLLAVELGLEITTAKRTGLFHDIGKAVNHEIEGAHALVGAEMLKRYGESEEVVNGVASHHDEIPAVGPWGILVSAADAISASRPGARSETMTTYLKRLDKLERIGLSFTGVEKCFAIQAGRELRVIVQPDQLNDEQAYALARSVARKVEEELQYPGQIRVTVIRETRCVEFAK
jgi:ribonuclease Y